MMRARAPRLVVGTAVSQGIAGNTPNHHQHPHEITENLTGIINASFPLGSSTETARTSRALSLNVSGCPNTRFCQMPQRLGSAC